MLFSGWKILAPESPLGASEKEFEILQALSFLHGHLRLLDTMLKGCSTDLGMLPEENNMLIVVVFKAALS